MTAIDLGFNPEEVLKQAIGAAKTASGGHWTAAKELAKKSAKDMINAGIMIKKMQVTGDISEEDAKQLIEEEKIVARIRLRSLAGIGLAAAQAIVNAIMDILKGTVNTAIGWDVF